MKNENNQKNNQQSDKSDFSSINPGKDQDISNKVEKNPQGTDTSQNAGSQSDTKTYSASIRSDI